ncbi:MAG: dihydrofolate reductase [Cyanobacteria bacterium P01_E01_bin.6]
MTNCRAEIILIAAMGNSNRVIGHQGKLPWNLPDDLKRFRALTTGHAIIMGRKTWEEGLERRSLPNRHSIIVSRTLSPHPPYLLDDGKTSYCVVSSLNDAWHYVAHHPKAFVIGGASLYAQTLEYADRLELTLVDGVFDGDTFFPEYESLVQEKFVLIHKTKHIGFQTTTYARKRERPQS